VRPAVVGDDVEPARQKMIGDPDTAAAVVADAVEVDDGPALLARVEPPALQVDARPLKLDRVERTVRLARHRSARRVQERVRPPGGRHARARSGGEQQDDGDSGQAATMIAAANPPGYDTFFNCR